YLSLIGALSLARPYSFPTRRSSDLSALVASGGVGPYTYSIVSGNLPGGLTLNPATGAITGTPTTAGSFNFTAKVVDASGNAATNSTTSTRHNTINTQLSQACAYVSG